MSKQEPLTERQKVRALYERFAGKELATCDDTAERFMERGYKPERAWAEVLSTFRLVKNQKVEL